jgi:hypothetical protein
METLYRMSLFSEVVHAYDISGSNPPPEAYLSLPNFLMVILRHTTKSL